MDSGAVLFKPHPATPIKIAIGEAIKISHALHNSNLVSVVHLKYNNIEISVDDKSTVKRIYKDMMHIIKKRYERQLSRD